MGIEANAQRISEQDAISAYLGTESDENLNSQDMEYLHELYSRPLEINLSDQSRLITSGLFTAYQVASLLMYRKMHGDVLSFSELASLDGFDRDFTERTAPFISLKSVSVPGMAMNDRTTFHNDLAVKGGIKGQKGDRYQWNSGMKYRLTADQGSSAAFAISRSNDGQKYICGHLAWKVRRFDARLIAGDFNARFGQGLTLWNGMSMSGVSSVSSVSKCPSYISPAWSFTGSSAYTGLAASLSHHGFTLSAMLAGDGFAMMKESPDKTSLLPALNLSLLKGCVHLSVTNYAEFTGVCSGDPRIPDMKSAADLRCCLDGTDIFGEITWDWVSSVAAAVMGGIFPAGDPFTLAVNVRYYPYGFNADRSAAVRSSSSCTNEYGTSLAADFRFGEYVRIKGQEGFGSSCQRYKGSFALDAAYFPYHPSKYPYQIKAVNLWDIMLSQSFRMSLKITERLRGGPQGAFRTEARADLKYMSGSFAASARLDVVKDKSHGLLSYFEGGYKEENLSVYLRLGLFFIDNWDDRIYVYERDAPGNFNVPAYYGRGLWSALTSSWRFSRWGRIYLRGAFTSYPFMPGEKKKPGKAELKLQTVLSF